MLQFANSLAFSNLALLSTIDLPELQEVAEHFWIYENPLLPNCKVTSLRDQVQGANGIGGDITIRDNANPCDPLPSGCSASCTEDCSQSGGYVCLPANSFCADFAYDKVFQGDYRIENADDLQNLTQIQCITKGLTIQSSGVSLVELPQLQSIGRNFFIRDSINLQTVRCPALETVNRNFNVSSTSVLAELGLPTLAVVNGYFYVVFGCINSRWVSNIILKNPFNLSGMLFFTYSRSRS